MGPDSAVYKVRVCNPVDEIEPITVSDCHVVLGLINHDNFIGGTVQLDRQRAYEAVKKQLAEPLGLSVEDVSYGVIALLESQLRNYLESMILGQGFSPSQYVCFSYGGGGPLHTSGYIKGLGFKEVLILGWAAGFSAFGCGAADFEYRYDKTLDISVNPDVVADDATIMEAGRTLQSAWDELKDHVASEFEKNDYTRNDVTFHLIYRMQFQGQVNDIEIEAPVKEFESVEDWNLLIKTFEEQYARVYAQSALSPELGYAIKGAVVRGVVEVPKPAIP